ncbi:MAG: hypothetical protein IPJ20_15385 [Flammeovirgaceae bacterium]|nr:hypothetical protein [Flammeovirgaceae bacterium]
MSRFRNFRLDWANHLMGFFSAILGIYIAFGLENYREKNNEKEKVEIAKQAIKKEIEDNLSIYKDNIDKISSWLEYMNFCDKKRNDTDGYQCGTNELDLMVKNIPKGFVI